MEFRGVKCVAFPGLGLQLVKDGREALMLDQLFSPQMAHCVTLVQLSVSCDHLIDKDIGSKSDPLCVLLQDVGGAWTEVRRIIKLKVIKGRWHYVWEGRFVTDP